MSLTGVVLPGMKAEVTDDSAAGSRFAHVVRISAVLGNSTLEDDALVRPIHVRLNAYWRSINRRRSRCGWDNACR